jgi:hypothetical protein
MLRATEQVLQRLSEQIRLKTTELGACPDEEGKRKLQEELAGLTARQSEVLAGQMKLKKQLRPEGANPANPDRAAQDQLMAAAKVQ